MPWEGFRMFIGLFVGLPLLLAAVVVVAIVSAVCAVPVGMVWALAAMVRPQIVRGLLPSWPPTTSEPVPGSRPASPRSTRKD